MSRLAILVSDLHDMESDPAAETPRDPFIEAFHRGDSQALERCYRENYASVLAAIRLTSLADRETVAHDLFCRIIANPELRKGFRGGNMRAWLRTAAVHAAIDFARKYKREISSDFIEDATAVDPLDIGAKRDAEMIVARFVAERLPPEWKRVFEVRFVRALGTRNRA